MSRKIDLRRGQENWSPKSAGKWKSGWEELHCDASGTVRATRPTAILNMNIKLGDAVIEIEISSATSSLAATLPNTSLTRQGSGLDIRPSAWRDAESISALPRLSNHEKRVKCRALHARQGEPRPPDSDGLQSMPSSPNILTSRARNERSANNPNSKCQCRLATPKESKLFNRREYRATAGR